MGGGHDLSGCTAVVEQIDENVRKYKGNRVFTKTSWVMFGQSDMRKLWESLEAYKMALGLGMHVISMSVNQAVKEDTTAIREQNKAIMINTDTILARLEGIRSAERPGQHRRLEEWIDDISALTTYAETTYQETSAEPTVVGPAVKDHFEPVYAQGEPGQGIGGYDLQSAADRSFALDYSSTGKLDHLVLYRPGTGAVHILQNTAGIFTSVYAEGDPGEGIGCYDLKSPSDRGLAFDYNSSGNLDHLVFYRPGDSIIFILRRTNTTYSAVYASGTGIGGFDLASPSDRIFAFDYDHSGKQDHLAIYRPGTGTIWVLRNSRDGTFTPVYKQGCPGSGIAGYDLLSENDRAFAFDWDGTHKMDHIALYRPGYGAFSVIKNSGGTFTAVFTSDAGGGGVGGYDLASPRDVAFAYDWTHSGRSDHIALYRPGAGTFWVLAREGEGWQAVYAARGLGRGVGGYNLQSVHDKMFAFDYAGEGRADYLVAYRASGTGTIWVLRHISA